MSVAPAAPPLAAGVLFHRPAAASAFDSLPFRAKTNPFNYGGSGGSGGGGGGGEAGSSSGRLAALSPPPSGSVRSASSSGAASSSPDALWKVHLKQQCMQRVKANRSSLVQKMRSAVDAQSPPPLNAAAAAQAAAASDALSQSLRGIIEDQFLSQRSQAAAAAAASAAAGGHHVPGASYARASRAYFGDGCSPDDAFSYTASDCEGGLTQDELIELMAQLEEELRSGGDDATHSQHDAASQGMHDAPQPTSHIPITSTAAAAASFSSAASFSAAASASPFGSGASGFGSSLMAQQQAAAWDAEAAAQMEADLLALQEYESVQLQPAHRVPCPVCHDPNVSVSSGSGLGASSCAACLRCGLRYAVQSVDEFRQHLSDACELHMQKCAAAPKFTTPHYAAAARGMHAAGPSAAAAASAASSASAPAGSATLALVCEVCQTWLTLPVPSSGFASHQSSQNHAADDDDDQAMAS